ncbi:type II toxin-antitoxin system HicB family antitoxin [Butyrivibrio sp. MC2013]|uniref:type II toxin-antitoxin system HicB family antitoxin n=1 Tax=Butyrivibrio sp. MC2013 TaxID=1280686 RepID=UPI00040D45ED|nr:hypothetical protein [Butyrivibrio sp. MC2013]
MTIIYPAVVKENTDGSYCGYFPDLAECRFKGRDINFALDDAAASMYDWVRVELEEEEEPYLPPVSEEKDIELSEGEFVRNICIHYRYTEGWEE